MGIGVPLHRTFKYFISYEKEYIILFIYGCNSLCVWGGVILTSCESENKDDFVENNPPSSFMSFVGEDTLRSETRAATTTSIPSFGLSCSVYSSSSSASSAALGNYFFNKQLSNNTTTSYLWPGSSNKCSFYGYYPYGSSYVSLNSTTSSKGAPSYSLTVPADISKQVDFCVAEVKDVAGNYQKKVTLPFSHVCSSLSLKVKNTGNTAATLKSVSFYGVKLKGTYSNGTWTTSGSASTSSSNAMKIALNTSVNSNATVDVSGTSNKIIVIPQTIAAGTKIFDVLFNINGEDKHFYYSLPSALTLNKGTQYTYTLNINIYIPPAQSTPVDLGLPSGLKWAAGNIGAKNPEDYGLYFAWGETKGYTAEQVPGVRIFDKASYKAGPAASISADLTLAQDAARANLGGNWRMPTDAECQELLNNCDGTWVSNYMGKGVAGRLLTSKVNGNSIFFPATGYCDYPSITNNVGEDGRYWTASWVPPDWIFSNYAHNMLFESGRHVPGITPRHLGLPVRGVCK